jgi:hypothetical protein
MFKCLGFGVILNNEKGVLMYWGHVYNTMSKFSCISKIVMKDLKISKTLIVLAVHLLCL